MTVVYLDVGCRPMLIHVTEGVAELRELVDEGMADETLVEMHRAPDGALIVVNANSVELVMPDYGGVIVIDGPGIVL